ncbi:glycosyltransferase [Burkholderia sp. Ac-20353]|uniref:glycosyltransferase n=1 Tax=Burkholderia sp. Ac-20353 TaxID=2703894 RepID=UPI00197B2778|nr:glycosyltransferase [Burkholderia sp. Ac-20353]MBN3787941.1 hypothetical protein [Burkholderia sp. Ac-20353]
MRILIATAGSHGDVLPFIALGRELSRRGHDIHMPACASGQSARRKPTQRCSAMWPKTIPIVRSGALLGSLQA